MNEATHYDLTGPEGPNPLDARRRQRNLLIGLSIGSAIVLFLGILAVLLTRSDSDERVGASTVPAASVAATTTTTSAPTTTTTTTSTTTTTLPPVDAIADAGPDLAVDVGGIVTLEAAAVTDGASDADVMWVQTGGPDVTAGVGALGGRAASFGAPDDVLTLTFDLVVAVPASEEAVDSIVVRVFEQADAVVFVDGETGDDQGADGSVFAPYRTIGAAAAAAGGGADIYVRSGPEYAEADTIVLGPGTSLYGGFVDGWFRDVTRRAAIDAAPLSIAVVGDGNRSLSALEVIGRDAEPGGDAIVVRIDDGETVTISDSRLVAGDAGDGMIDAEGAPTPAGVSVGVLATSTGEVRVERSTLGAGTGGAGAAGVARGAGEAGAGRRWQWRSGRIGRYRAAR